MRIIWKIYYYEVIHTRSTDTFYIIQSMGTRAGKKCDSCNNFIYETTAIKCFTTGRIFKIRRDSSCQTKNVIYFAYCLNCQNQGVVSTVSWKPRLTCYKSHVKNNMQSFKIIRHLIKECKGTSNLHFMTIDVLLSHNTRS